MTDTELWRQVGVMLRTERQRRSATRRQVAVRGSLNYQTVELHEQGIIRTTAALRAHFTAFGWRLDEVLRLVLNASPPVNQSEVLPLVSAYDETSDLGRAALVLVAQALPRPRASPAPPPTSAMRRGRAHSRGGSGRATTARRR
jgi:hypothetical protein